MIHILVVDDDKNLNQTVCTYLNDCGFEAKGVLSANEAYDEMYNNLYELIISDIMMPEIDGFEFAETVRQVNKQIPILFMSAKDDLPSKRKGFLVGIDDYMVKPVELAELEMRVRALLRRSNIEMERKLIVGNLEMDADGMTAMINGEEIPVTTREFNILYKLLSYPKKTFTRAQLMDEFWGLDSGTSTRAVDVYVTKLRDKFSTAMDSRSKLCVDLDTKRYCYRKGLPETMNKLNHTNTIKNDRFPSSLFLVYFLVLLLMSGIHTGIIVGMNALGWNKIIQVILPLGYWTVVAVGLTLFTKNVIGKAMKSRCMTWQMQLKKWQRAIFQCMFQHFTPLTGWIIWMS